jgi:hypothetical protein
MQWKMKDEVFTVFAHRDDAPGLLIGTESGGAVAIERRPTIAAAYSSTGPAPRGYHAARQKEGPHAYGIRQALGWRNGKQSFLQQGAVKDLMVLNDGRYLLAATGLLGFLGEDPEKDEPLRIDLGTYVFRCNALAKANGMVQAATSIGIWQFPEQGEVKAKALNKDVIATGLLWVGDTLLASTFGRGILMLHQGKVVDSIPYPSKVLWQELQTGCSSMTERSISEWTATSMSSIRPTGKCIPSTHPSSAPKTPFPISLSAMTTCSLPPAARWCAWGFTLPNGSAGHPDHHHRTSAQQQPACGPPCAYPNCRTSATASASTTPYHGSAISRALP